MVLVINGELAMSCALDVPPETALGAHSPHVELRAIVWRDCTRLGTRSQRTHVITFFGLTLNRQVGWECVDG